MSIPENFGNGERAQNIRQAASEMAEVCLDAILDYGESFDPKDMRTLADAALSWLPVEALADVIVERLVTHGFDRWDEEREGKPPTFPHPTDAYIGTEARLVWSEVIADVDYALPRLDGSYRGAK